jgi:eukaryotic-like serine/threonine-protein kinase
MAAVEHKYRVLKRLEAGGMAEVYLGEAVSVQGFKKRVAIKRVLPHLAQNESFIAMFLDEARLSARLNHANIVSVFDISKREAASAMRTSSPTRAASRSA